jgi:ketosteroid isomerase-like protein
MHPFRAAIEARDLDAMSALLADDVVLRSPIMFKAVPAPSGVIQPKVVARAGKE